jgi:hypothetical protein
MHGRPTGVSFLGRLLGGAGGWLLAGAALLPLPALATSQEVPPSGPAANAAPSKGSASRVAQARGSRAETRPAWSDLGADQRRALQPLAGGWPTLSEAQKRKWIALSRNFARMSPEEQAKLHSRMNEWVALSPQQRTQARLNFGETKNLSADDKKAKWEAYQALSAEEKRKLAAGAGAKTPPTAAAVRPVPAQKLANVPRGNRQAKPPRIAAGRAGEAPSEPVPLPQPQGGPN